MIDYETFQKIRQCCERDGLSIAQTAAVLGLDERTVAKWSVSASYQARASTRRASKLDPFRSEIDRLLHQHPYTAQQILQRLREGGYTGGYSILKELVSQLRPPATTAYLTLQFLPGQCAQVDWGSAGWLPVGATRRRLSFFVMVLAYSRRLYVEFTLAQSMEHFLSCHQNALAYFGGVTTDVMVDNCGDLREKLPIGGPDAEEMLILHGDTSRDQTLGMLRRELLVELSIPAQLLQFHSRVLFGPFITSEKISNRVAFLYFWQERPERQADTVLLQCQGNPPH